MAGLCLLGAAPGTEAAGNLTSCGQSQLALERKAPREVTQCSWGRGRGGAVRLERRPGQHSFASERLGKVRQRLTGPGPASILSSKPRAPNLSLPRMRPGIPAPIPGVIHSFGMYLPSASHDARLLLSSQPLLRPAPPCGPASLPQHHSPVPSRCCHFQLFQEDTLVVSRPSGAPRLQTLRRTVPADGTLRCQHERVCQQEVPPLLLPLGWGSDGLGLTGFFSRAASGIYREEINSDIDSERQGVAKFLLKRKMRR